MPHIPPNIQNKNAKSAENVQGSGRVLFQNQTEIISTNPLMVLCQLYFVLPDVLAR